MPNTLSTINPRTLQQIDSMLDEGNSGYLRVATAYSGTMNFNDWHMQYRMADGELPVLIKRDGSREVVDISEYATVKSFYPREMNAYKFIELLDEAWDEIERKIGNQHKMIFVRIAPQVVIESSGDEWKLIVYCFVGLADVPPIDEMVSMGYIESLNLQGEKVQRKIEKWEIRWRKKG